MESSVSAIKQRKHPASVFVSATVVLFFLSLSAADSVGFVPYYVDGTTPEGVALSDLPELGDLVNTVAPTAAGSVTVETAKPERISISSIGLDLPIQNPETKDIATLDTLLQKGPARYVDSAKLGEQGNLLVFAHSSHLPVIHNQMYKAFNRVPELKTGDSIVVSGGGNEYVYSVTTVRRADADDEVIDLSPSLGQILTLVTCDTFTSKSTRWIVEASFVGSY